MGKYAADPKAAGRKWLDKIKAADKREERWQADAAAAEKAYSCGMDETAEGKVYEFNILHSNVETIVPAIFNSQPIPDIRERFRVGDADPLSALSRMVAGVYDRAIRIQIDDGALEQEIERVAQDAYTAGRGILRLRFDADEVPAGVEMDPMTGMPVETPPSVENERIRFEAVSWRDFRMGPAQRWNEVPWVAFRLCITAEEMERITDPAIRDKLGAGESTDQPILAQSPEEDVYVWEIWCKATRTVKMVAEASGLLLTEQPDPLSLPGFFPMPEPLQPVTVTGKMTPVCPFSVYKKLADELETITRRIKHITSGIKVKAAFAGASGDVAEWAQADDNTVTPLSNLEGLAQTGGIDKALAWWPIDTAIVVLRELYQSREQVKAMIYEITGISDIIRGQGEASETATAQQIKTEWGALRIKKMQRQIERMVRDVFVLCAEIISRQFTPPTLAKMTGIQLPRDAMAVLSKPMDHYRIDVETNSTVRADMSARRGEMGEFLEGTGAFFNVMGPLVMQAPAMAGPVIELYAAFARQFSLGKQAEDALEQLSQVAQQAQQEGPSPEEAAAQAQAQAKMQEMQMQMQLAQQKFDLAMQEMQAKGELDRQKMEGEAMKMQATIAKINADIAKIMASAEAAEMQAETTIRVAKETAKETEKADG